MGRHLLNVLLELHKLGSIEIEVFGSKEIMGADGKIRRDSPLHVFSGNAYPCSQRMMQNIWKWVPFPKYTTWCPESDWLYCPNEAYVPSGRTPFACTVHDLYSVDPEVQGLAAVKSLRSRKLLPRLFRAAERILCVSDFTRGRVRELFGVEDEKLHVVGNGVDERYLSFDRAGAESPVGSPYLLSIGGFRRKKGAEFMIALAPELARRMPEHRWIVIGPVDPEYREAVSELSNVVPVARGLSDAEMIRYSAFADAFLMLSLYEGFGIPVLESMALRVPVAISSAAALTEVAGEAAVVLDTASLEEAAGRTAALIEDADVRNRFISAGRKRAEEFTWKSCATKVLAALSRGPKIKAA